MPVTIRVFGFPFEDVAAPQCGVAELPSAYLTKHSKLCWRTRLWKSGPGGWSPHHHHDHVVRVVGLKPTMRNSILNIGPGTPATVRASLALPAHFVTAFKIRPQSIINCSTSRAANDWRSSTSRDSSKSWFEWTERVPTAATAQRLDNRGHVRYSSDSEPCLHGQGAR